jgi:hypothetical protein
MTVGLIEDGEDDEFDLTADRIENTLATYDNINCSVILLRILTKKLHEIADEDDRNEAIAFVSDMVLAVKEWPR